jgi:putative transcriptional regulator
MTDRATETPLKRVLREQGRVQRWLAERIGVDEATLSRYVNGLHVPLDKRLLIAEALEVPVEALWPSEPPVAA